MCDAIKNVAPCYFGIGFSVRLLSLHGKHKIQCGNQCNATQHSQHNLMAPGSLALYFTRARVDDELIDFVVVSIGTHPNGEQNMFECRIVIRGADRLNWLSVATNVSADVDSISGSMRPSHLDRRCKSTEKFLCENRSDICHCIQLSFLNPTAQASAGFLSSEPLALNQ